MSTNWGAQFGTAWQDPGEAGPPTRWWTGTQILCDDLERLGIGEVCMLNQAVAAGDTFAITFQNFSAPTNMNPGWSAELQLWNEAGTTMLTSWNMTTANGPTNTSYTFNGSEGAVYLQASVVDTSGDNYTTYGADFSLTPPVLPVVIAPNLSVQVGNNQTANITPAITIAGVPVQGYTLAVVTPPTQGTVSISQDGTHFIYTPTLGTTNVPDSFTYTASDEGGTSSVATVSIFIYTQYNCSCDAASTLEPTGGNFPTQTLAQMERKVLVRLGFAAMPTPPPGMAEMIDNFLADAQEELYRVYQCFRTKRWFTWDMQQNVRFYEWGEDIANMSMIILPPNVSIAAATTGGTVPAGTTTYGITSVNDNGESTPTVISVTNTGATSKNTLTWGIVAGAKAYGVYVMAPNGPLGQSQLSLIGYVNNALSYVDTTGTTTNNQPAPDINTTSVCSKVLDPRKIEWVGISRGDNVWQPLYEGIHPTMYTSKVQAIPQRYEVRSCIEVWPAPSDNTWQLRIKGDFGLLPFTAPTDVTTIDSHAIFLKAVADAKAHYQQPDAQRYDTMLTLYLTKLQAGTNSGHRAWPGKGPVLNAIPPRMVGEDS